MSAYVLLVYVRACDEQDGDIRFAAANSGAIRSASSKFYGQATKGAWWMPWQKQAMKDVASCDKPRGAASRL
jgi:hypothetical protein